MKKNRAINNFLKVLGVLMVVSLSSCLKNGQYYADFSAVSASVDLPLAASNNNDVITFAYNATVTTASIPAYVNVSSPTMPTSAVTVTMGVDTAWLNKYNTANGTSFVLIPDSVYTATSWNRTIPVGQRLDSVLLTFNFAKMDLSQPYVLPITIKSSSLPIEQWNHLMINPTVKNKYDGYYTMKEFESGWGAYSIADGQEFAWPTKIGFQTTGASSNQIVTQEAGPAQVGFTPTGGIASFGAATPKYIFDATTNNLTSIPNLTPDSRNRAFTPTAGGGSRFDPATHNVYLNYHFSQTGRPDNIVIDTLLYIGPR